MICGETGRYVWYENYTGTCCEEASRRGEVRSRKIDKMGAVIVQTSIKGVERHIGEITIPCRG